MSSHEQILQTFPAFSIQKTICTRRSSILLAKHLPTLKNCILKVFPQDSISQSLYHKENEIHTGLSHPNVIQHFPRDQFSSTDSTHLNTIFMEYAPYGDFFNLIIDHGFNDEKLVRTFFHHLIDGLEYLHSKNIAHLDLKPENLLLGEDFQLKLADFDLSREVRADSMITSGGTANYRAPEILFGRCVNYYAADIYSAGICLYTLMIGAFPFTEEGEGDDKYLFRYDKFVHHNEEFWEENQELGSGDKRFSQSFRELINMMLKEIPSERMSLQEVKQSKWYNEPVYSKTELRAQMRKVLQI